MNGRLTAEMKDSFFFFFFFFFLCLSGQYEGRLKKSRQNFVEVR
jgi:hypothetical protein